MIVRRGGSRHGSGVRRSDLLLVRMQLLAWRRVASALGAGSGRDRIALLGGGLLVLAYVLGLARQTLIHAAPFLAMHRPAVESAAAACVAFLGLWTGHGAAKRVARDASGSWLAPLPWPAPARRHAMRLAVLSSLCVALAALLAVVTMLAACLDPAPVARLDGTAAAIFGPCFLLSGRTALRRIRDTPAARISPRRPTRTVRRSLSWADRGTPRWVGSWALGGRASGVAGVWLLLLGSAGLVGVVGSLETATALPGAVVGLCGGHLVFLIAMRAHPLRAPALVVQPVALWRAAWATTRLPMLLSFAWMGVPGLAGLLAAPTLSGPVTGAAGLLLLLDGLFAFIAFSLAEAPGSALLLHAVAVVMAVENYAKFGGSELVLLLGFVVVLWRRAGRHLRGRTRHAGQHA